MTVPIKFANNAFGILAANITNSATSVTVASGEGARFPSLGSGDFFFATLIDASNNLEIVKCTARSSDVLTITRAQESTTARAYSTGDRIELRGTAQTMLELLGPISHDGTAGTGDLTIDVEGDITLDANGGNIFFKDNGTEFLEFEQDGGGCTIRVDAANTDLKFVGNDSDGSGTITALTLDMSAAGAATFNSSVTATTTVNVGTGGGFYLIQDSSESIVRSETQPIILQTYASGAWQDRVAVINSGNVGIGSTDPHAILDVKTSTDGRILFADNSGDPDIIAVNNANSAYTNLKLEGSTIQFRISGSERMRLDSSGNVGIGGSPVPSNSQYNTATLHLSQEGNASSTNKGSQIKFTTGSSGHTAGDGGFISYWHDNNFYFNNQESGQFRFYTNGGERISIGSSGQIGIAGANYGTSGQVLTSGGASGAVSWADAGGSGSTTKISTVTVSSAVPYVDFTLPTSGYTYLLIQYEGTKPATDNTNLVFQLSSNGGTGFESIYFAKIAISNSSSIQQSSGTSMNLNNSAINGAYEGASSGFIRLNMGSQSNDGTSFDFKVRNSIYDTNQNEMTIGVGNLVGTGNTANFCRFKISSGNIDQGKFVLYGIA